MHEALAGLWAFLAPNRALLARLHALLQARRAPGLNFAIHRTRFVSSLPDLRRP